MRVDIFPLIHGLAGCDPMELHPSAREIAMHSTSFLTKAAFDTYLRHGLLEDEAPTILDLKQARTRTHYIWRTRRDGRVRSSHAENDGKVFAWDNPPSTGHPGEAPGCRCYAESYAPQIEESIRIVMTGVTDSNSPWSSRDFTNHYYAANGRGVALRQTGHLVAVASAFMQLRGAAIKTQHIATPARLAKNGPFGDQFENVYDMESVVFSLGGTTIGGQVTGIASEQNGVLSIAGQNRFRLQDVFEEPINIADTEAIDFQETIMENLIRPADAFIRRQPDGSLRLGVHTGEPFHITDEWSATFDGQIYTDTTHSRFR